MRVRKNRFFSTVIQTDHTRVRKFWIIYVKHRNLSCLYYLCIIRFVFLPEATNVTVSRNNHERTHNRLHDRQNSTKLFLTKSLSRHHLTCIHRREITHSRIRTRIYTDTEANTCTIHHRSQGKIAGVRIVKTATTVQRITYSRKGDWTTANRREEEQDTFATSVRRERFDRRER